MAQTFIDLTTKEAMAVRIIELKRALDAAKAAFDEAKGDLTRLLHDGEKIVVESGTVSSHLRTTLEFSDPMLVKEAGLTWAEFASVVNVSAPKLRKLKGEDFVKDVSTDTKITPCLTIKAKK